MKKIASLVLAVLMAMTAFVVPINSVNATEVEVSSETEMMSVTDIEQESKNIGNLSVSLDNTTYTYSGTDIRPVVSVYDNETKLTQGTDYEVEYINNRNVGEAKVVIRGINNYEGEVSRAFTIVQTSIQNANISLSKLDYDYTGECKTPAVTVTYNGVTMSSNDYSIEYSNNIYPGVAKVTVTGKGNFTGSVEKKYYIARIKKCSTTKRNTDSITISWEKEKNIDGYIVYKWSTTAGTWKSIKNVKGADNNSFTIKKLTPGSKYKYSVRAYKKTTAKTYYGERKELSTHTRPSKVDLKSAKPDVRLYAKISWKERNCTGYQIKWSRNSDFSNAKTTKVTSRKTTCKTITGLRSNSKYYVKVRAYVTNNGVTTYGAWSNIKSFKSKSTGWFYATKTKRYYYKDGKALEGPVTISGNKYYFDRKTNELRGVSYEMWSKVKNSSSDTEYLIAVSKSSRRVCVYKGSKGKWQLKSYWKCTVGAPSTPTPSGSFKVPKATAKYPNKQVMFGWKEGYSCWYSTKISGPYLFHSVLYQPRSKTVLQDGRLGYALSHGCVRLSLSSAHWIYKNIDAGTRVIIY